MTNFFDVFDETFQYPDREQLLNGVPMNTLFEYVSSTYLEGFINYVNIKSVILIQRYWDKDKDDTWDKFVKDSIKEAEKSHTKYGDIGDDVLILAESDSSWWFFWNDKDCSDCEIGRIDKNKISLEDAKKLLIKFIESYKKDQSDITGEYVELPIGSGWRSL